MNNSEDKHVHQQLMLTNIGAWRSLVAHLHGVQVVGGSNPLAPIKGEK